MAAVLPPLIAAGGFGLYFLTSFRLARYRRVPWEFLAVVAAGAALGVYRLVAAPGAGTAIGAGLALGLPIRFLSDERGTLMDALHVLHRDGMPPSFITHRLADGGSRDLFLSTTFLLDEEGVIRWVYRPDTYRVRAPAREVLRAIDALP